MIDVDIRVALVLGVQPRNVIRLPRITAGPVPDVVCALDVLRQRLYLQLHEA